jgi:hypothetical protein
MRRNLTRDVPHLTVVTRQGGRQVREASTPNSCPSVSGVRSVSTSWRCSRTIALQIGLGACASLCPGDRCAPTERAADRLDHRLRSIHDEQAAEHWVGPAFDQVVQPRLHHGGLSVTPSSRPGGCLAPGAFDADRSPPERHLTTAEGAHARPRDRHLAAVEAGLPTVRPQR